MPNLAPKICSCVHKTCALPQECRVLTVRVHQANGEPGKDSYTTWLAITSVAPLWQGFAENTVPAHGCKFILETELLACCEPALLQADCVRPQTEHQGKLGGKRGAIAGGDSRQHGRPWVTGLAISVGWGWAEVHAQAWSAPVTVSVRGLRDSLERALVLPTAPSCLGGLGSGTGSPWLAGGAWAPA